MTRQDVIRTAVWVLAALACLCVSSRADAQSYDEVTVFNSIVGHTSFGIFGTEESDDVVVRLEPGAYVVAVPGGVIGNGCSALTPTATRCPYGGPRFVSDLADGDDRLTLQGGAGGRVLRLGGGGDFLSGSAAANVVDGDEGPDSLRGRAGNDRLYGDAGRDRLLGGSGNDLLYALDGERDAKLRCGNGTDHAIIDRVLDPAPRGCERVTYRAR